MTKLSVNINKIALIRNAREGNLPDLYQVAQDLEQFGAEGITVHPRPDERHIRYADIPILKALVTTEFNIEGYPSEAFLKLVLQNKPDQCTLVPDPPGVLTSNAGWDCIRHQNFLAQVIDRLHQEGIRVSLFIEPDARQLEAAKVTGTDRIEFYTGPYAAQHNENPSKAVSAFAKAALVANQLNLGINAGHDLNLKNLKYFKENIPNLLEVSIGHALISDALYYGLANTVAMYKDLLH
ncbi:MAG TPA: pyridoxine 5'-phosphate synthase [Saprospiraceae bacterium]|nr:pyridoxine 5'-phosphate synthase [Saprospiraceae bacterium]